MSTDAQHESPPEKKQKKRSRWLPMVGVAVLLAVAVMGILRWFKKEDHSMNVPLGVEQAAIVTYSGPKLTVTPYKWGVAVNMRIARMTEHDGTRVYDVRYIVNREGTFDLKDYLIAENGSKLVGLPSFKFHGDPTLSKNLDTRIQETEEVRVDVGGYYYATLTGLAAFWILWLLMLIFFRRPKKLAPPPPAPPGPTFAEILRDYLRQIETGTLDAEGKAKMEMLLLRRWREDLALEGVSMYSAFGTISQSAKTGKALRELQDWLHRPSSKVRREDITALLKPFATS